MLDLLDVTSADIENLSDSDLRILIGRLCEADFKKNNLPTSQIHYGGHQDAADGGIDVSVKTTFDPPIYSHVSKRHTVFQVKKSDMPRAKILKEMRPGGVLRDEIKDLIIASGAYTIVSSSHASEKQVKNRMAAMEEAVRDFPGFGNLTLDFLEANKIATWLRNHESLVIWVRDKAKRPLFGWQPYGNWTGHAQDEYIMDEHLRLINSSNPSKELMEVKSGLAYLQNELSENGKSVRLTGLSGVGKTRFVEALFDERVTSKALNSSEAVYCDVGDEPRPNPDFMLEQLISGNSKAVLIIDNCKEALHNRLTKILSRRPQSNVKLLTIEYDVREDLPEETQVYKLEPASNDVVVKILEKRFPHLSALNRQTIADFSGGNARVAIYLAKTVKISESLTKLSDNDLFERLFWQRHSIDNDLYEAAQVFSLLYSFNGEDVAADSELSLLGSFIGNTATELYKYVRILQERELIQARSNWRAVLPHVIANRLAQIALSRLHPTIVSSTILASSERVIKSFSRRLSYLHDCAEAVKIVEGWLAPRGWIGKNYLNLNFLGIEVLNNIASVSPQKTLEQFELAAQQPNSDEVFSRKNTHCHSLVSILSSLAYDPEHFERSVKFLIRFALTESPKENVNSIRNELEGLFHIYLSNTHATVDQRRQVVLRLLESDVEDEQELGISLLKAALETFSFTSFGHRSFGARPRDYGYYPQTREEVISWYKIFLKDCIGLCLRKDNIGMKAELTVIESFRALCKSEELFELLQDLARQIRSDSFWVEGWIKVNDTIYYDSKDFEKDQLDRLKELERQLRPRTLREKAEAILLHKHHHDYDPESEDYKIYDESEKASDRIKEDEKILNQRAREIAVRVIKDKSLLDWILSKLLRDQYYRSYSFGQGLGQNLVTRRNLLNLLRGKLADIPIEQRSLEVVYGLIQQWKEEAPVGVEKVLDEIAFDPVFAPHYPGVQCALGISERGFKRLMETVKHKTAPIDSYIRIAWGRAHESIDNTSLAKFLNRLLLEENGYRVVAEIFYMRLHGSNIGTRLISEELIETGRKLITEYIFNEESNGDVDFSDHRLAEIANVVLVGENGFDPAKITCINLVSSKAKFRTSLNDHKELINAIARQQPLAFLDTFLAPKANDDGLMRRYTHDDFHTKNPFDQIKDATILQWCETDPYSRYQEAIKAFPPFILQENAIPQWKPIVFEIIDATKNLPEVLKALSRSIRPMVVYGSRAKQMLKTLELYEVLFNHKNPVVAEWAKKFHQELESDILSYKERELLRTQEADESFE